MQHLTHNKNPLPARLVIIGFLFFVVLPAGFVSAQSVGSSLPPEAQEAYERGYAAAEQGEWGLAIKCFSEVQGAAPESPEVLFNLAFACSNAGGRDILAIAWYRAYLAAAPDAPNARQVRKEIINLEVKVEANINELFRLAKDTAGEITNDFYKSGVYSDIVQRQAETGDIAGARDTAAEITGDYLKSDAYREIAEVQAKAGDIAGARESLTRAIKAAESIEDDYYKSGAYKFIAGVQAETGDIAGAKATAARITDDSYKSAAYRFIAEVQAKAGDMAGARESLARAIKAAESIKDDHYKFGAYRFIAGVQAKTGDIAGAKTTAALITDDYFKSTAYREIAGAQAEADKATASRKSTAPAKETAPTKVKYEASAEIKSWTGLAITYRQKQLFTDIQGLLKSLKGDKSPRDVAKNLVKAAGSMAVALKELQDNEVKWQELRAKSTP